MSVSILVVDDDPQIVRLVRSYMEQAGWQVTTLLRGDEVLPSVRAQRPDLIVLDLMLPGSDGLEVLRTLRGDPSLATLPVLLLTARVDDVDRIVGLELGADDYVTKPFNPREVVARVKAILRRTQSATNTSVEPPVHLGDLRIDPAGHLVELAGQPMQLTPSEFAILYLMMRNPGRAFSRTQLVEEALGYDYAGLERTVDSHIKNLRRKLDVDPGQPSCIETVFGVGYRFHTVTT